jgi:hypothetical protein
MIEVGYGAGKSVALLIERWRRLAQEYRDEAERLGGADAPEIRAVLKAWAQARENCAMELRQELGGC